MSVVIFSDVSTGVKELVADARQVTSCYADDIAPVDRLELYVELKIVNTVSLSTHQGLRTDAKAALATD
jgi:hypothetical protein